MAVYHLACRILADGKSNPPARVAKYHGNCALPSCKAPIVKGDTISCTRDNENGTRKAAGVKGAPDFRDIPPDELPFPEGPITQREPPMLFATMPSPAVAPLNMAPRETWGTPVIPGSGLAPDEAEWVPRETLECARRRIAAQESEIMDLRNVLQSILEAAKGAL